MEILLVCENEANVSKIARFLKKWHVNKIPPRNIFIHSTGEKSVSETAFAIRKTIESRKIYEDKCLFLMVKIYKLFDENDIKKRNIFVVNLDEVKRILNSLKLNHKISLGNCEIEHGSIISISVNNEKKEAVKIFP